MQDKKLKMLSMLTLFAALWAFAVICLGAYTRLTDAGLSCPDWPGCYGHFMVLPGTAFSHRAWAEMIHRYFAGILVMLILVTALLSTLVAIKRGLSFLVLALCLFILVMYQALLGMWTVTLQLWPVVVTQHLLGGFTIFSVLWLLHLKSTPCWQVDNENLTYLKPWVLVGLILLILQIALGAWTSTNYAALSCMGFPVCHVRQWDFARAFNVFTPLGVNYQNGILSDAARSTIQMVHRVGALLVFSYFISLSAWIFWRVKKLRVVVFQLVLFLFFQVLLGILNVVLSRPLWVAVLHNVVALLLLATVISLNYLIWQCSVIPAKAGGPVLRHPCKSRDPS